MDKIVLIDGNSYLYKVFYGMPELFTKSGQPTNAIYGFIRMILKVINKFNPKKLIVTFDMPGGSDKRKELHTEYKSNRQSMPDNLKAQRQPLERLLGMMEVPVIKISGVEADDVIAKLAMDTLDIETYIVSSDKDLLQLVNKSTLVYDVTKDKIIDEQGVIDKLGIKTNQVCDLLSLMGDASDNIPGVPGIGPKTAIKLLQEYGSLQDILNNLDNIKGVLGDKIREYKDQALLSYELAKPHLDIDIDLNNIEDISIKVDDDVISLLKELELHTVLKELSFTDATTIEKKDIKFSEVISTSKDPLSILLDDNDTYVSDGKKIAKKDIENIPDESIVFGLKDILKKDDSISEGDSQISLF